MLIMECIEMADSIRHRNGQRKNRLPGITYNYYWACEFLAGAAEGEAISLLKEL
jgi:hypothetical protein